LQGFARSGGIVQPLKPANHPSSDRLLRSVTALEFDIVSIEDAVRRIGEPAALVRFVV